jgi:hypothetical protein
MIRRNSGGNARNGMNRSHALRQAITVVGFDCPKGEFEKSSNASAAASTVGAV